MSADLSLSPISELLPVELRLLLQSQPPTTRLLRLILPDKSPERGCHSQSCRLSSLFGDCRPSRRQSTKLRLLLSRMAAGTCLCFTGLSIELRRSFPNLQRKAPSTTSTGSPLQAADA